MKRIAQNLHRFRFGIIAITATTLLSISTAQGGITTSGTVSPADPSTWTTGTNGYIAGDAFSTGSMTINDGSQVNSRWFGVGNGNSSDGTVTVEGVSGTTRSLLKTHGHGATVGGEGKGTLNVLAGGQVNLINYLRVGQSSAGNGTVLVSGGTGSLRSQLISSSNTSYVGEYGTGLLQVKQGAQVALQTLHVSYGNNSDGNVIVTGIAGGHRSILAANGGVHVGHWNSSTSKGLATVADGGKLKSTFGSINNRSSVFTVNGKNGSTSSHWEVQDGYVSVANDGTLVIQDGGLVTADDFTGAHSGTKGMLSFGIGTNGTGLLDLEENAVLGDFKVELLDDFTPNKGDSFTLIKSATGTITGLSNVDLLALLPTQEGKITWTSNYTSGSSELTITASEVVPEPSSALLASLSLVGLGFVRRRRK